MSETNSSSVSTSLPNAARPPTDPEWTVTVSAPGRVCLFGDKTDLADLPVMAATISLGVVVRARQLPNGVIRMTSTRENVPPLEYSVGEKGDFTHPLKYWCAVTYVLKEHIGGFEATLDSTLPMGKGMASSGAISVAFTMALNLLFQLNLDKNQIAATAYDAEHNVLGIPCGRMDQWSIAHSGVCWLQTCPNPKVRPISVPPHFALVVGDTTEPRPLIKVLPIYKKRLADKDETLLDAFEKIESYLEEGAKELEKGNLERVGELMNMQMEQENRIGAATARLNELCTAARNGGAYGAKLMGAGGGGCMVALCSKEKQKSVCDAIEGVGGISYALSVHYAV